MRNHLNKSTALSVAALAGIAFFSLAQPAAAQMPPSPPPGGGSPGSPSSPGSPGSPSSPGGSGSSGGVSGVSASPLSPSIFCSIAGGAGPNDKVVSNLPPNEHYATIPDWSIAWGVNAVAGGVTTVLEAKDYIAMDVLNTADQEIDFSPAPSTGDNVEGWFGDWNDMKLKACEDFNDAVIQYGCTVESPNLCD